MATVTLLARSVTTGVAFLGPNSLAYCDGAASARSIDEPVIIRGSVDPYAIGTPALKRVKFLTVRAAALGLGLGETVAQVAVTLAAQGFAGDVDALFATAQAVAA